MTCSKTLAMKQERLKQGVWVRWGLKSAYIMAGIFCGVFFWAWEAGAQETGDGLVRFEHKTAQPSPSTATVQAPKAPFGDKASP